MHFTLPLGNRPAGIVYYVIIFPSAARPSIGWPARCFIAVRLRGMGDVTDYCCTTQGHSRFYTAPAAPRGSWPQSLIWFWTNFMCQAGVPRRKWEKRTPLFFWPIARPDQYYYYRGGAQINSLARARVFWIPFLECVIWFIKCRVPRDECDWLLDCDGHPGHSSLCAVCIDSPLNYGRQVIPQHLNLIYTRLLQHERAA